MIPLFLPKPYHANSFSHNGTTMANCSAPPYYMPYSQVSFGKEIKKIHMPPRGWSNSVTKNPLPTITTFASSPPLLLPTPPPLPSDSTNMKSSTPTQIPTLISQKLTLILDPDPPLSPPSTNVSATSVSSPPYQWTPPPSSSAANRPTLPPPPASSISPLEESVYRYVAPVNVRMAS